MHRCKTVSGHRQKIAAIDNRHELPIVLFIGMLQQIASNPLRRRGDIAGLQSAIDIEHQLYVFIIRLRTKMKSAQC